MTTQRVMTQTANLFGNATGSVTNKGKQNGSGFDLMIGNSMKAQKPSEAGTTVMKSSVQKKDNYFTKQSDDAADATQQVDKGQTKAAKPAQNTDADNLTGNTQAENTADVNKTDVNKADVNKADEPEEKAADVNDIDQQLLARITAMLQAVSGVIMEKLNLSPEQFNQLLNEQGMTAADLLDPGNLQKFILASNGEPNILSVLTDENLADMMKNLMQQVNEIVTEAKIPITLNQIKELLTKAEAADIQVQKSTVDETLVKTAAKQTETDKTVDTKVSDQPKEVSTAVTDTAKVNGNKAEVKETADKNSMAAPSQTEGQKNSVSGSHETSSEGNNKDMKASDPFQAFIDNMVKAAENNKLEFADSIAKVTDIREIANQIIERIKIAVTPDQTSMEMQLNPDNLGKVNLAVQSKDGVLTAQFVVQNQISKEAIESQLNTLRETLNQQGIKVEAIEVTVSANAFEHGNNESGQNQTDAQKNNTGRHITLEDAMNMTELPEEESILQDITGTLGSQIDYTA